MTAAARRWPLATLLLALSAASNAQWQSPFYLLVAVTDTDVVSSYQDGLVASCGDVPAGSAMVTRCAGTIQQDGDAGVALRGGYQFSSAWALELGLESFFGRIDGVRRQTLDGGETVTLVESIDEDLAIGLSMLYHFSLNDSLSLFLRGGLLAWDLSTERAVTYASSRADERIATSLSGVDPIYGVGMDYAWEDIDLAFRMAIERIEMSGSSAGTAVDFSDTALSVGLLLRL